MHNYPIKTRVRNNKDGVLGYPREPIRRKFVSPILTAFLVFAKTSWLLWVLTPLTLCFFRCDTVDIFHWWDFADFLARIDCRGWQSPRTLRTSGPVMVGCRPALKLFHTEFWHLGDYYWRQILIARFWRLNFTLHWHVIVIISEPYFFLVPNPCAN